MKRLLSNRWFKMSLGLLLVLSVTVVACAWHFRIWSWRDLQIYKLMSRECHPVWRDLHWGRIHAGQDVEQVIAATNPIHVERYGEFIRLNYQKGLCFTGVTLTARNGRIGSAAAWSCTWDRVFFDELTQEDWKAFSDAFEAHWGPIIMKAKEAEREAAIEPALVK